MDYRIRHLEQKLREYAQFFKVVLVVGARQVGKSSMLSHVFPDMKSVVFDAVQDIYNARGEVDLVLEQDGLLFPIEIKYTSYLSGHDTRGIRAFRETYGATQTQSGIIIYAGQECMSMGKDAIAIPWNAL